MFCERNCTSQEVRETLDILKATTSAYYLEVGEIAEVKFTETFPELCLVFYEGTDRESKWPCSETSPEFFDFYEKIA